MNDGSPQAHAFRMVIDHRSRGLRRSRLTRRTGVVWSALKGICLSALLGIGLSPATAAAQNNPIVIENQQPGTSQWQISGVRATDTDGQIKGYASAPSVNKGENITFYVSVNPAQTYTIDVYRLGWYQGLGARLMQHIGPLSGVQQPTCPTDATTGMIECQWTPGYALATQTSWTSGIYLALLTNSQNYQNYIVFAVRDDSRTAALLYQQPVTTYQAYNDYPYDNATGKSLYAFNSFGATTVTGGKNAAKVSFDRPYHGDGTGRDWGQSVFSWEISFIRWIEQAGYDVPYVVTNSGSWVYAGTGFQDGDSLPKMVGYEADRLFSQYPQPNAMPGTYTLLSNSPIDSSEYSNSSVYQAPSGAWVFGAGTMNWSLALDNFSGSTVDPRIQRTTANILDRFHGSDAALTLSASSESTL